VATSGNLAAAVTSDAGQINLNLVGIPTFGGAGAIALGSGAGTRTGSVVLQSAGDLNVAALPAGAISIGSGNSASLGLSSGGTLTLPATGGFADAPPLNLSVQGTHDVVSSGGADPRQLSFTAQDLSFISGGDGRNLGRRKSGDGHCGHERRDSLWNGDWSRGCADRYAGDERECNGICGRCVPAAERRAHAYCQRYGRSGQRTDQRWITDRHRSGERNRRYARHQRCRG